MAIDHLSLNQNISSLSSKFKTAQPFPHVVIDNFLLSKEASKIISDYPQVNDSFWTHYIHYNEKKHGLSKWEHIPTSIQRLITEFSSTDFIKWLEKLTGIPHLIADPKMEGAGLHQTKNGGFLNIHADFTVHPKRNKWKRRVNVLIYLNEDWKPEYGGSLELWSSDMKSCITQIEPKANRVTIFSTGKNTFHGYPTPLTCPDSIARKSIALYYYTQEKAPEMYSTAYQPRPTDGARKWLIWGDTFLLSVYTKIKGIFGINDDFVSSILKYFNNKK
jgi:Rps23 Pro-64 3,4-dihydroxylase Tpa1-like proline 4-hydroxylase